MSILQTAREVVELVQKADNIDLMRQVLRLQTEVSEMAEENRTLKDEIRCLKQTMRRREAVEFDGNRYWLPGAGASRDGPFCQRCFDVDGKLVREVAPRGMYYCKECVMQSSRHP